MMNVLDILSDSSRRVPMQMLLKIERALEQIELGRPAGSIGPPTPARKADGLGQPLLDALQASVKAPLLNHSLKRTFAPTLDALFGEPPKLVYVKCTIVDCLMNAGCSLVRGRLLLTQKRLRFASFQIVFKAKSLHCVPDIKSHSRKVTLAIQYNDYLALSVSWFILLGS